MNRLLPHPILSVMLLAIWLLLANTLSLGQVILGAALAWAVPLYTARFWPDEVQLCKPLVLLRFLGVVLYDILVANLVVARLILGPTKRLRPAFIQMPLRLRSEVAISLLANTVSLTPGTVSACLSADHRTLVIHSLHITDAAAALETIRDRYETPLKEVFESC
jgi:multicomponent K+:H+ antiporter subunit E